MKTVTVTSKSKEYEALDLDGKPLFLGREIEVTEEEAKKLKSRQKVLESKGYSINLGKNEENDGG